MSAHYRHTQVGWMILGVAAALALFLLSRLPTETMVAARVALVAVAAPLLLVFSALTVEVDREAIALRFGIGLVRKRIPLADVSAWQAVRNPWYSGWGIRLGPRGVLWNVSGFDAVELTLPGGRHFRVGTDEPAALVSAITQAKGVAAPPALAQERPPSPRARAAWTGSILALLAGASVVGWIFWSQVQPPAVTIGERGFAVDTLFYGQSFAAADITAISLEPRLPPVRRKTNGFDGAGTLRGRFQVESLGEGRLYVEQGMAPYVLVRLRQGFVVVNFREPERTTALYEELARQWPDRVATAAP
jgi:hypothetical protein